MTKQFSNCKSQVSGLQSWLLNNLTCPRDHKPLRQAGNSLRCPDSHVYPVIDGVPVLLRDDVPETHGAISSSLASSKKYREGDSTFFIETLGISAVEKKLLHDALAVEPVPSPDPVIQYLIGATNGNLYKHLIGNLPNFLIPQIPLPPGSGQVLLDLGCNWGRWCIAAAMRGYKPIGIDPSLGAVMAARRAALHFGVDACFLVADCRFLPLRSGSIDVAFSYSVLQHFSKEDVKTTLRDLRRVLNDGGSSLIQMASAFGLRSFQHQLCRQFREPMNFEVRYWRPSELKAIFTEIVGPSSVSADCYFGLGIQRSDAGLMPPWKRLIISCSELLKRASKVIRPITLLADSVYLESLCIK